MALFYIRFRVVVFGSPERFSSGPKKMRVYNNKVGGVVCFARKAHDSLKREEGTTKVRYTKGSEDICTIPVEQLNLIVSHNPKP